MRAINQPKLGRQILNNLNEKYILLVISIAISMSTTLISQSNSICAINIDSIEYYNNKMGLWQFDKGFGIPINKNKFDSIAIVICNLNNTNDTLTIANYIELIRITNTLGYTGLRTICPFYYRCCVDFFNNRLPKIIQSFNLQPFVGGSLYDSIQDIQIGGPPLINNSYYHIIDLPISKSE